MVIAHLSDIHFGRIAQPGIVEHLIEEVNSAGVDVVAVSGDLTQRARTHEFAAAAEMIAAFHPPTIVVPGNHDVYAWWWPYQRIMSPLRRFQKHITDNLHPTFVSDTLAVLGINSAHGRTVKGGRIGEAERGTIETFFSARGSGVFKVLIVHHHLSQIQALWPHDVARHAKKTLEVASRVGVDLVLCGHLHISHIEPLELTPERHRMVIASAGTATSNRGRGEMAETNFYNLIYLHSEHFIIEERRYQVEEQKFVIHGATQFQRDPQV